MREQLKSILEAFENKVDKLEEDYKIKNKNKMKRYVNRKLKKEIQILNFCNIMPSVRGASNIRKF